MKNGIKLLVLLFLLNSCKEDVKKPSAKPIIKTQESEEIELPKTVYKDYTAAPVDFLDDKYKIEGIGFQGDSPMYPKYNFYDKEVGEFRVSYIGKSRLVRHTWNRDNPDGFLVQFKGKQIEYTVSDKLINDFLKREINNYYVVADFWPKEGILDSDNEFGEMELKDDAYTYFYVYDNNKWIFIKRLLSKTIEKQGLDLFTDILLSYKLKDIQPVAAKFQGKFRAEVDGEYTMNERGHTTYSFTITENKIDLKSIAFRGDFLCEGEYKWIQQEDVLELYYNREDDRCLHLDATYLIKKEDDNFFIKGIGGEGTINDWIKMIKE